MATSHNPPPAATDRSICSRTMGVRLTLDMSAEEIISRNFASQALIPPRQEERDSGGRTMGVRFRRRNRPKKFCLSTSPHPSGPEDRSIAERTKGVGLTIDISTYQLKKFCLSTSPPPA